MSKSYYKQSNVKKWLHEILRDMGDDNWKPDYIVGIGRGGLVPAVMLSNYLEVPMHSLKVTFREGQEDTESNLWMAEDAFGYVPADEIPREADEIPSDPSHRSKILIVDDINDTGRTFKWIKKDWESSCMPMERKFWDSVWGENVRFAVLVNNEASKFKDVSYRGTEINKNDEPTWVVFPWENWWS